MLSGRCYHDSGRAVCARADPVDGDVYTPTPNPEQVVAHEGVHKGWRISRQTHSTLQQRLLLTGFCQRLL